MPSGRASRDAKNFQSIPTRLQKRAKLKRNKKRYDGIQSNGELSMHCMMHASLHHNPCMCNLFFSQSTPTHTLSCPPSSSPSLLLPSARSTSEFIGSSLLVGFPSHETLFLTLTAVISKRLKEAKGGRRVRIGEGPKRLALSLHNLTLRCSASMERPRGRSRLR